MPILNMISGGGGTGGTLTVTAPANTTVTISNGDKTKSKTSDTNGTAIFKGLETGTWTVTITNGTQTTTKTVDITADYAMVIAFFAATIAVTYPEGSTLTCSDGTTTLTATTTTGSYTFTVPNTGTWTVSCTDGNDTASQAVSITADGVSVSVTLTYFDGYLFNYGSVNEQVTGGWGSRAVGTLYNNGCTLTAAAQDDGSIILSCQLDKGGIYITNNKIDLTEYSTLTFCGYTYDLTEYGRASVRVWSDIGTTYSNNIVTTFFKHSSTVATHQIDITSLTGSFYVGVSMYHSQARAKLCYFKLS